MKRHSPSLPSLHFLFHIFSALVALVTYFIVGGLINYFHLGARGVEIIPQYLFWKDLPFLIKVFL